MRRLERRAAPAWRSRALPAVLALALAACAPARAPGAAPPAPTSAPNAAPGGAAAVAPAPPAPVSLKVADSLSGTLAGLYIAYGYPSRRRAFFATLAAGIVVPIVLLQLGAAG